MEFEAFEFCRAVCSWNGRQPLAEVTITAEKERGGSISGRHTGLHMPVRVRDVNIAERPSRHSVYVDKSENQAFG